MRVSVNWLKEYTNIDISLDELVQKIGAQLGAVEEVVDLSAQYKGAVIVAVVSCEKHPNADKLLVCLVDDGGAAKDVVRNEQGLVQVVCGAPNVREGMLAVWLPPKAVVPSTYGKDEFTLEARELRGVVSNGMLASASELAISNDHSGLLEVEVGKPGQAFADVFELNDQIIDIENKMFTHRPDLFGILGVAREVAGIQGKKFISPDWYLKNPKFEEGPEQLRLGVHNELPELVSRFMAVTIADVSVKPSPVKLQSYLTKVGIKPINNIVDVTNYIMYLTGQPLHAYDYDKVIALSNEPALVVRKGKKGEELKALGGKTITLNEADIVIATDKQAIGLGGVIGGADTEVDENTKNIILECANFDMYTIRRTSMAHGLFTDAVTRFTKGQSPLQNDRVIAQAIKAIHEVAGGKQTRSVIDNKGNFDDCINENGVHKSDSLGVTSTFINERLGLRLNEKEIKALLENVEFQANADEDGLEIYSPFWRTDIEIVEDVVEEVGRLYGFDHVPLALPKRSTAPVAPDAELQTKKRLRHTLAKLGANEVLTYSFVHGNLLKKSGQDEAEAYKVSNALSPDLQYYRLSLAPSLLSLVHPNIKAGNDEFALFEIGKVHGKSQQEDGLPKEFGRVGLVYAASDRKPMSGAAFYEAKTFLSQLLSQFSITPAFVPFSEVKIHENKLFEQLKKPFDTNRLAAVYAGERLLGVIGEFSEEVGKNFKLPQATAGFELFLSVFSGQSTANYQPLSRFPSIEQDLCLKVSADTTYEMVLDTIQELSTKHKPEDVNVSLSPIDIYQDEKDKTHKQITVRLALVSYERTLTSDIANNLLDAIAGGAKTSIGAIKI